MNLNQECIEKTNDKKIVCKEKKQIIIFYNDQRKDVLKIRVDGCQITVGKKCDYLVEHDTIQNYIELKGKNLSYAFLQLEETIKQLKKEEYIIKSFIVSSYSPLSSVQIQQKKLYFKKKLKSELTVKNNKIEVSI